jgi:hypothetical protein
MLTPHVPSPGSVKIFNTIEPLTLSTCTENVIKFLVEPITRVQQPGIYSIETPWILPPIVPKCRQIKDIYSARFQYRRK